MNTLSPVTRILRLVLPVLAIASVGGMGVALLHSSNALTSSNSTGQSTPPVSSLPTSATADSCCHIDILSKSEVVKNNRRVTLQVRIQNLRGSVLQLSPGLQMYLKDSAGETYNYTARYLSPGKVIGGPLAPAATTTLPLDFDLPSNTFPVNFVFQEDASSKPLSLGLPQ